MSSTDSEYLANGCAATVYGVTVAGAGVSPPVIFQQSRQALAQLINLDAGMVLRQRRFTQTQTMTLFDQARPLLTQ